MQREAAKKRQAQRPGREYSGYQGFLCDLRLMFSLHTQANPSGIPGFIQTEMVRDSWRTGFVIVHISYSQTQAVTVTF